MWPVAGPQQSWQPSHQRLLLHDGATSASNSTDASPIGVKPWHVAVATSCGRRSTARNNAAGRQARAPQQADVALPIRSVCVPGATGRARMAEKRLHGECRACQYDRSAIPSRQAAARWYYSTRRSSSRNAPNCVSAKVMGRHDLSCHSDTVRARNRRGLHHEPSDNRYQAGQCTAENARRRRKTAHLRLQYCGRERQRPNSDTSAVTCRGAARDVAISGSRRWCLDPHGRCTILPSSFPRKREPMAGHGFAGFRLRGNDAAGGQMIPVRHGTTIVNR